MSKNGQSQFQTEYIAPPNHSLNQKTTVYFILYSVVSILYLSYYLIVIQPILDSMTALIILILTLTIQIIILYIAVVNQTKSISGITQGVISMAQGDLSFTPLFDEDVESYTRILQEYLTEAIERYRFTISMMKLTMKKISEGMNTFDVVKNDLQSMSLNFNQSKSVVDAVSYKESTAIEQAVISLNNLMSSFKQIVVQTQDSVSMVSTIAKQTNLMAINATIEANKAGPYGRGFAVVAENIQRLSDDTKRYAHQMNEDLNELNLLLKRELETLTASLETITESTENLNEAKGLIDVSVNTLHQALQEFIHTSDKLQHLSLNVAQFLENYYLPEKA